MYAQVVFGLAISGPFDYIVPAEFRGKIKPGARVRVSFGRRMLVGYVVGLLAHTKVRKLKPISELIDAEPLLNDKALLLTKWLSEYYCCSWGEAIETWLPEALRKGRVAEAVKYKSDACRINKPPVLLQCPDRSVRWGYYLKEISRVLNNGASVIVLLPDTDSLVIAKEKIESGLNLHAALLYRKQPKELDAWLKARQADTRIVLGTRSAVFAQPQGLGLIIVDEEGDFVYKQDQVPHYHARELALKRAEIEGIEIILGASVLSLESIYLYKQGKAELKALAGSAKLPQIDVIAPVRSRGARSQGILSKYASDSILSCLASGQKALIFINRKGFATSAYCHSCGLALKCPRCAINLVYHFQEKTLSCHYCNFKMPPPEICPSCNAGYIKYSGLGTEKIESELSRIFPQARIAKYDAEHSPGFSDADILVASQSVIKAAGLRFSLVVVMAVDSLFNRIDFRALEKTFYVLAELSGLAGDKIIVETHLGQHYMFSALKSGDYNIFYDQELKYRKELSFPPYRHFAAVKLRGSDSCKVKDCASKLMEYLNGRLKDKSIKFISLNPGHHPKLRGNFYWQLLFSSPSPEKLSRFLKISLKDFSHSGIIVTVDIDPI